MTVVFCVNWACYFVDKRVYAVRVSKTSAKEFTEAASDFSVPPSDSACCFLRNVRVSTRWRLALL
jgi:hypothetical protein